MPVKYSYEPIVAYDNHELIVKEPGVVVVQTVVQNNSLNPYGNAHGGFLFTLCDSVAGGVAISLGVDAVTSTSSINYLKAARLNDKLTITGTCVHNGRKTKVVSVDIFNQKGEMICQGSFTMFVINLDIKQV